MNLSVEVSGQSCLAKPFLGRLLSSAETYLGHRLVILHTLLKDDYIISAVECVTCRICRNIFLVLSLSTHVFGNINGPGHVTRGRG